MAVLLTSSILLSIPVKDWPTDCGLMDRDEWILREETRPYLKPSVELSHLFGVLSFSNSDTLFHLLCLCLNIFAHCDEFVYGGFKRSNKGLGIEGYGYLEIVHKTISERTSRLSLGL